MTALRLRLGGATADLDLGVIRAADGRETVLRPKTAEVLRVLAARPGEVVSKDALLDAVWVRIAVVEDSLVQCVSEIRSALGDADRSALRTVPKRGYLLAAAAQNGDGALGRAGAGSGTQPRPGHVLARELDAEPPASPTAAAERSLELWPRRSPPRWFWPALAASVVAAGLGWTVGRGPERATAVAGVAPVASATAAAPPAVAVLPFEPLSGEGEAYLGTGIAHDLNTALAGFPGLRVLALSRPPQRTARGRRPRSRTRSARAGWSRGLCGARAAACASPRS